MKRHIHIYFAPRKTRDQAPGSVPGQHPPAEVSKLVQVLMQAIRDRQQGLTTDAQTTRDAGEWDESKHPRSEGGQFSSAQHAAAAKNHEDAANNHEASAKAALGPAQAAHMQAAEAHRSAAELHAKAHSHMAANTGLGEEFASQAHAKTAAAKQASSHPAVQAPPTVGKAYGKLKQIASDPKQPMVRRAAAVKQLNEIEKNAEALASSPHAQAAKPLTASGLTGLDDPNHPANKPMPRGVHPEMQAAANAAARQPDAPARHPNSMMPAPSDGPAGDKPTQATAKGSKAAVHQLLSTGHPFHVDELMKATGVTNKATIMTALSDLKNPKYAGQLGALTIEKRPDGMYHVTKAPSGGFKAVGGGAAAPSGAPGAPAAAAPAQRIAAEPGAADPHAVTTGSHPLSPYVPGDHVQANVGMNKQPWKVLGHNAEGHVVLQKQDGTKHRVEPGLLGKMTSKVAAPKGKPEPDQEAAMAAAEAYEGPMDDKSLETAGAEAGEDARKQKEHNARLDAKGLGKPTWAPGAPGAPRSALKEGMAAGLKKNLKAQKVEGKNRVERALGNHSSTFVKQALAAQKSAPSGLDHPDGKRLADHIDDMNTSLRNRPDDKRLQGMVHSAQAEFKQKFGSYYGSYKPGPGGVIFPAGRKSAAEVTRESQARIDRAQKGSNIPSVRTGPGGGGPLPMAKDPRGFDRNPVQNVQARMDAKKTVPLDKHQARGQALGDEFLKRHGGNAQAAVTALNHLRDNGDPVDVLGNSLYKQAGGMDPSGDHSQGAYDATDKVIAHALRYLKPATSAPVKPIKGATTTGQSFLQRVPISKAKALAAGSSKPLHVQRQEKLDAEKKARLDAATPNLHNYLGSGAADPAADVASLHGKSHGPVNYQGNTYNGNHNAMWDLTFRRNTAVGAFHENRAHIDRANQTMAALAKKHGVEYKPYTLKDAQERDARQQANGESPYSEYEQSMGGHIQIPKRK